MASKQQKVTVHVVVANDKCPLAQTMRIPRLSRKPITDPEELKKWDGGGSGPGIFLDTDGSGKLDEFWGSGDEFQKRVTQIAAKRGVDVDSIYQSTAKLLSDQYEAELKKYEVAMSAWIAVIEPCLRERMRDQIITPSNRVFIFRVPTPAGSTAEMKAYFSSSEARHFSIAEATTLSFTGY